MESVDECLPPTEKETSERSMSGLLAQGDKDRCVSVQTGSDIQTMCPLHRRREEDVWTWGLKQKDLVSNVPRRLHQYGESVSMK